MSLSDDEGPPTRRQTRSKRLTIGTPAGNNGFDDDLAFNPILDEPSTPRIDDLQSSKTTDSSRDHSVEKTSCDKIPEKETCDKVSGQEKSSVKEKDKNQSGDKTDFEKKRAPNEKKSLRGNLDLKPGKDAVPINKKKNKVSPNEEEKSRQNKRRKIEPPPDPKPIKAPVVTNKVPPPAVKKPTAPIRTDSSNFGAFLLQEQQKSELKVLEKLKAKKAKASNPNPNKIDKDKSKKVEVTLTRSRAGSKDKNHQSKLEELRQTLIEHLEPHRVNLVQQTPMSKFGFSCDETDDETELLLSAKPVQSNPRMPLSRQNSKPKDVDKSGKDSGTKSASLSRSEPMSDGSPLRNSDSRRSSVDSTDKSTPDSEPKQVSSKTLSEKGTSKPPVKEGSKIVQEKDNNNARARSKSKKNSTSEGVLSKPIDTATNPTSTTGKQKTTAMKKSELTEALSLREMKPIAETEPVKARPERKAAATSSTKKYVETSDSSSDSDEDSIKNIKRSKIDSQKEKIRTDRPPKEDNSKGTKISSLDLNEQKQDKNKIPRVSNSQAILKVFKSKNDAIIKENQGNGKAEKQRRQSTNMSDRQQEDSSRKNLAEPSETNTENVSVEKSLDPKTKEVHNVTDKHINKVPLDGSPSKLPSQLFAEARAKARKESMGSKSCNLDTSLRRKDEASPTKERTAIIASISLKSM